MSERRLIYVWNYREWGGAQIYFLSLMKEAKKSFAVSTLIPSNSDESLLGYLDELGVSVDFLPPAPPVDNPRSVLSKISRRFALLRSENNLVSHITGRYDLRNTILHVDLGFWQSFLPLLRLSRQMPVFMTVHTALTAKNGLRRLLWALKGRVLSRFPSFHILASNHDARESLRKYLSALKFHDVEVAYSGIDPEEISRVTDNHPGKAQIVRRYKLPNDRPIIATVGQFIPRKGCWVVMDALSKLKARGRSFVFLWLATSPPDAIMLSRIERYGLGESFLLMHGEQIGRTRHDLLTLVSAADIFVLASLQEGLPIALIEAMALGLPCIATNVNAIPEAIIEGKNGRLVAPANSDDLAEAIATMLDEPTEREKLGAAAKETAYTKFNARRGAERTVKLYEHVWKSRT